MCYEFQTRIGETQYANYSEGTIKLFTDADHTKVKDTLTKILTSITLSSGAKVVLP